MDGLKLKPSDLPERISGLTELSYNLWWSWHPAARMLLKMLNRVAWKESGHNPIKMLNDLALSIFEMAAKDPQPQPAESVVE